MSTAGRLLKGSFFRNVDLLILLGANLIITPFIVRSLGARMYGFWTLVATLSGYYGLLDLGLSSAAARYVSRSLGLADMEDLRLVADTAFLLFCLIGLATLAVTGLSAAACPLFMNNPSDVALLRKIILLLGTATAIGFPMRIYWGILTAYIKFEAIAGISIARTLLSNTAIFVALRTGHGIMTLAVIAFAASVLQNGATYAVCRFHFPGIRISLFRYDARKVRDLFDHSWKTFVCTISDIVRVRLHAFVIAGFMSVSLVTPYAVGAYMETGLDQLVLSTVGVLQPVFSRYEGRGDYAAIKHALLVVTRLSSVLASFLGLSIMFYASAFIRRWMGPGFDASARVAMILCAGAVVSLPQFPGVQLLYGLSKHDSYAAMTACEAAVSVILSLILLKPFGIYGVALGTLLEILIFKLLVQPVYVCRSVGLPVRVYLLDTIGATLLKSGLALGVYFFLIRKLVVPDYGRLCLCVAVQTALFAPAAYFFLLGPDERNLIRDVARSLRARRAIGASKELDALA